MTRYLLQGYHSFMEMDSKKSKPLHYNNKVFLHFHFHHAEQTLRIFTFGWLVYQAYLYTKLSDRPDILFTPMNWFGYLFMPDFPSLSIYLSILFFTLIFNISCIIKRNDWRLRLLLFIHILYLNSLNWNYGFFSHVGHLFVLIHFFTIFVPVSNPSKTGILDIDTAKSIRGAYIGFMASYTISGLWKIYGLIARFTVSSDGISWLSNNAALYNSIIGHKSWDLPLDSLTVQIFTIPYLWPIMFLIMLILQLTSFLATIRLPLFFWIGFGSIGFHIFNLIFMKIEFIITPIILLILFFPYHKLFKKRYSSLLIPIVHTEFTGHRLTAFYQRVYQNNETDIFTGFYAYREYLYDREKWYAGLLFIPGLASLCSLCWKYLTRKGRDKTKERGEHASVPAD